MNYNNRAKSHLTNEELKMLIIQYFEQYKFKLQKSSQAELIFNQGSLIQNMFTFNPLNWKSKTIVQIVNSEAVYNCKIDSTFQAVTKQEIAIWDNFISNLHKTIESGILSTHNANYLYKQNRKSITKYLLYSILGAVVIGIPSGIISFYTEIDSIVSIGAVSGALIFLYWKINEEKSKGI